VDRYKQMDKKLYLRGDAAFASPDIYEYLEGKEILYAIRLKANNNLYREIDHLMTARWEDRPGSRWCFSIPSPTGRHHGTGREG
jgi:hypothetical protein